MWWRRSLTSANKELRKLTILRTDLFDGHLLQQLRGRLVRRRLTFHNSGFRVFPCVLGPFALILAALVSRRNRPRTTSISYYQGETPGQSMVRRYRESAAQEQGP